MADVRILIVEDDGIIATRLLSILAQLGYNALGAVPSGEEAIQRIDEMSPDLILMDIYLAGELNGIETAAQIHNRRDVPVIYLTAYSNDTLLQQAKITKPFGYLIKPIQNRELHAAIEMALYRHRLETELKRSARLNQLLLDSLPHPAMLIRRDQIVLVANRIAREVGAREGDYCWRSFGQSEYIPDDHKRYMSEHGGTIPPGGTQCTFCLADEAFATEEQTHDPEVNAFGRLWDTWWVPVEPDVYLHYASDITERKQAEETLRRYAEEQAALYAVTSAVSSFLDPDTLLHNVLDVVLPLLDSNAGWVMLPGPTLDDPPRIAAWQGVSEAFLAAETAAPLRNCTTSTSLLLGGEAPERPKLLADCPRVSSVLTGTDLHSHASVPLRARDQVLGILNVAWYAPRPYPRSDRRLLISIGRQVGMALRNAQLYQSARQVDRLQELNHLDQALTATLDPETVVDVTLRQIATALGSPTGALVLYRSPADDHPEQILTLANGQLASVPPEQTAERLQPLLRRTRKQHAPISLSTDELIRLMIVPGCDRDSSPGIAIPIWGDEGVIAVLVLAGRPASRPFTDEDQALAQAAAGRAGQAIRNARLYDELRQLLHERDQTQAQLIHSEKMAALGRLTASIAHEINNPLQSMETCLTLVLEEWTGDQRWEKIKRYLGIIGDEIERISTIVHRMRDFYRPAHKGFQPTDLHDVLQSVLQLSGRQLQHSNVIVRREWARDLPKIPANADHLKQVFLNLVLNAIDAMPTGGTLHIHTALSQTQAPSGRPQPAVCIEFSDTGAGMPPEVLSRLFEPFFTTKEHGSGLGLSISYGIIQSHNGQISAASQPGLGTTFTILLPVERP